MSEGGMVFLTGCVIGFVCAFLSLAVTYERSCEIDHNVHDCKMVYVPVIPETTKEGE